MPLARLAPQELVQVFRDMTVHVTCARASFVNRHAVRLCVNRIDLLNNYIERTEGPDENAQHVTVLTELTVVICASRCYFSQFS